jgi:hypothetical protein
MYPKAIAVSQFTIAQSALQLLFVMVARISHPVPNSDTETNKKHDIDAKGKNARNVRVPVPNQHVRSSSGMLTTWQSKDHNQTHHSKLGAIDTALTS